MRIFLSCDSLSVRFSQILSVSGKAMKRQKAAAGKFFLFLLVIILKGGTK